MKNKVNKMKHCLSCNKKMDFGIYPQWRQALYCTRKCYFTGKYGLFRGKITNEKIYLKNHKISRDFYPREERVALLNKTMKEKNMENDNLIYKYAAFVCFVVVAAAIVLFIRI